MASEMEFELTEEKENGRPVYKNQYGTKYGACEEDLYDYLRVQVLGRISDFFGMAEEGDEETANMGHIFRLLVSDAEKKLERVFNLVEASIGDMTIHSLSGGYPWHDDALPLAVFLETKEAKAEERRKAQQEEAERRNPIKTAESFRQGVSTLLGDLQRDGFDALSIAKDILSGKPKPIEEYKKQVGKSKAPVLPLAGKAGKGNGKGVQHA